jgi:NADH dehydrogenase
MLPDTFRLVTLFGGGGFLGRYVAQALYKTGARVRIAQFDARKAFFLKPLGALGQTQFVAADIRNPAQVREAIKGSDAVVNLVGVLKGDFEGLHVDGARHVAEACAEQGVGALVQVSAIGADPQSESRYGRTKGEGEQAVQAAFPRATIVRPSIIFGREDNFINRFAGMMRMLPVLPVVSPKTRFQPVYAADAGRAITQAALHPGDHGARTFELGGPQVMSMGELMQWINGATGYSRMLVDVPDPIAKGIALGLGWAPGAPITYDQYLMLKRDSVVSPGAPGLDVFGIRPTPLAAVSEGWLTSYRQGGRFAAKQPY